MALLPLSPVAIALLSCNLASPLDALPPLHMPAGCHVGLVVIASSLVTPPPLKAPARCPRHLSMHNPLVCPWLVVASPCHCHRLSMCRLVVTLPLITPPSCLPRLVVPSPLVVPPPLNTSSPRPTSTIPPPHCRHCPPPLSSPAALVTNRRSPSMLPSMVGCCVLCHPTCSP